jgi:hypothetical protein
VHLTLYFLQTNKKIKEKKTRTKVTTEISFCQAENGFSWVELVKKLADAFENRVAQR